MTTQLIPFEQRIVGNEKVETVNGRDLHASLEIGKDYTTWMKAQIRRAQLIENEDFVLFTQKGEYGNKPTQEYFLTFESSKHVAMMSGSKKGKEIRAYFITCEKELRERPATRGDLLVEMAEAYRRQEQKLLAIEAIQVAQREELIATQQRTIDAMERSIVALTASERAETKADMALDETRRMTIEEFILINGLVRQFPLNKTSTYSAWLKEWCLRYGQRVDKAPVLGKSWDKENAYPIQALAAWLHYEQTKPSQVALVREQE